MDDHEIGPILAAMDRRIADTEGTLHRSLYSQIDWDDRLVCIKGAKGTGKTTMMLQYLKEHPKELDRLQRFVVDEVKQRGWRLVSSAAVLRTEGVVLPRVS